MSRGLGFEGFGATHRVAGLRASGLRVYPRVEGLGGNHEYRFIVAPAREEANLGTGPRRIAGFRVEG